MTTGERIVQASKAALRAALPARFYGPIRARRVQGLIDRFEPRVVEHRYAGFGFAISLQDPLGEAWYDRDWMEPPEILELRRGRLATGARVFDIGAHQGVVALILARIVGDRGHVVAVEAEPHNAAVARANAAANGAENLTIIHAAGGEHEGVLSFKEGLNGVVARRLAPGSIEVPSVSVDGLAARFGVPDVVLIDVEGYEAHVLAGARRTIEAGRTDFFIELHSAEDLAAAGSDADEVVSNFDLSRFELLVADPAQVVVADRRPPEHAWRSLTSMLHRHGHRCFIVVRRRPAQRT
jgi:FkbM family methyltransferase